MICEKCGNEIKDGTAYCEHCKSDVERNIQEKEETVGIVNNTTIIEQKEKDGLKNNQPVQNQSLVWHYIFCFGVIATAFPNIMSILSLISYGELFAALLSIVTSAWTSFSATTAILLLMRKSVGVKMIKIRSWIQLISGVLEFIGIILLALFAGSLLSTLIGSFASSILVFVIAFMLTMASILSIVIAIVNLKYYKKRQEMFNK